MAIDKNKGYIVEFSIDEKDYQKNPYIEDEWRKGKYISVLKPADNRAQITGFTEDDEYKVVYDHKAKDDYTMKEVKKQKDPICEKIMRNLVGELM